MRVHIVAGSPDLILREIGIHFPSEWLSPKVKGRLFLHIQERRNHTAKDWERKKLHRKEGWWKTCLLSNGYLREEVDQGTTRKLWKVKFHMNCMHNRSMKIYLCMSSSWSLWNVSAKKAGEGRGGWIPWDQMIKR
jgi:hypothetical protein